MQHRPDQDWRAQVALRPAPAPSSARARAHMPEARDGVDLPPGGDIAGSVVAVLRERRTKVIHGAVEAAAVVRDLLPALAEVPAPAQGHTTARFAVLTAAGAGDLSIARLLEGHLDAVTILREAGAPMPDGLLGVWAADPPDGRVEATRDGDGWRLSGVKRFSSGVDVVDAALVTAHAPDGYRLFAVTASDWLTVGTWDAPGMLGSGTLDAVLDGASGTAVGGPRWYLTRPGFPMGGIGVAAVWLGAAVGCRSTLLEHLPDEPDATGLAHLGAVDVRVSACRSVLARAARALDADAFGDHTVRAHRSRAHAAATATEALQRTNLALGTRATVADPAHARRVADLPVYLSQHHGDRDLASLGRLLLECSHG